MSDCGVCLPGFDAWVEFSNKEIRTARKEYECGECGCKIAPGQKHEYASGKCEGEMWSQRTCLICAEIGEAFYCKGRTFGSLWEDMNEVIGSLTIGCLNRLKTPEAKAELQRRWMEHKELWSQ